MLILGIFLGARRGFVAGVCKLAGTIFALAVAFAFCNSFQVTLEGWFGLTTALAGAIGNEKIAGFLAIGISFFVLLTVVKIGAWLIGKFGTALVEKARPLAIVNCFLGGLLGILKAAIVAFLLLTACKYLIDWLHLQAMYDFITSSTVVGAIFQWEWFLEATTFSFLGFNK
jgi:uncharacterized membrane protein required for colicin V production